MKKLFTLMALGLSLSLVSVYAADGKSVQQGKMASCNKEAGAKKGDERKTFMKECLSAKPTTPATPASAAAPVADAAKGSTTQQGKMKTCNADAKTKALKGDARKAFMKECLSAK